MTTPELSTDSQAWKDAEARRAFWNKHYERFLKEYPDQFVAVRDGEIVATSPRLVELADQLEARGLAPTDVWIEFFHSAVGTMIL
jgi:hypothetical protein